MSPISDLFGDITRKQKKQGKLAYIFMWRPYKQYHYEQTNDQHSKQLANISLSLIQYV